MKFASMKDVQRLAGGIFYMSSMLFSVELIIEKGSISIQIPFSSYNIKSGPFKRNFEGSKTKAITLCYKQYWIQMGGWLY